MAAVLFIFPPPISQLKACSFCHRHICFQLEVCKWMHTCGVGKDSVILVPDGRCVLSFIHPKQGVPESAPLQVRSPSAPRLPTLSPVLRCGGPFRQRYQLSLGSPAYKFIFCFKNW